MKTRTSTEKDIEEAWAEMPAAFRQTRPIPPKASSEAKRRWMAKTREDCNKVIVIMLETATADMARGQYASGRTIAAEVRPFERMKRVLDESDAYMAQD